MKKQEKKKRVEKALRVVRSYSLHPDVAISFDRYMEGFGKYHKNASHVVNLAILAYIEAERAKAVAGK